MDKDFLEWWLDQISVSSGESLGDHAELLCDKDFDARRIMENIKMPMLMLTPASSKLVNLDEQRQLNQAVQGSRMELIKGAGHEIYIDQAEQCQEKYLAFLEALRR